MKFIIDTDPGTDDAVAILIALANFSDEEFLAITTVAGNVTVDVGTKNALRLLEHTNRNNIPVYKGEAKPLSRELTTAEWVHGSDGLNGVDFPNPSKDEESLDAVSYIINLLSNSDEKITICVLGPMTNIGKVLSQDPKLASNIEQIIFMGGGAGFGNTTPVAEFNFFVDPDAVDIVLNSGVKLVMMGLDVTHQAIATKTRLEDILETKTVTSKNIVSLMSSLSNIDIVREIFPDGTPVHDAFVTAYLVDNSLTTGKFVNIEIETKSELSLGQSVIDTNSVTGRKKNVFWMNQVNDDKIFEIIKSATSKLP